MVLPKMSNPPFIHPRLFSLSRFMLPVIYKAIFVYVSYPIDHSITTIRSDNPSIIFEKVGK